VRRTGESGFILVATLWFVALSALVAAIVEGWISSSLDHGAALTRRVAAGAALFSAEQRVAFVMASGSPSPRGLELGLPAASLPEPEEGQPAAAGAPSGGPFIALDERPYRIGDVVVRLQDGAGLYDLNGADRDSLDRLLASYGVPNSKAEVLADALSDYLGRRVDPRTGNIGSVDYRRAGLPQPRHGRLLSPWEPLRILGWAGVDELWRQPAPFPELVTLGPIGALNLNTAPPRVLTALGGMDEREAARVVAVRTAGALTDLRNIATDSAAVIREDRPRGVMPSNILRLTLTAPGEPLTRISEIRTTPAGTAPVRVDYTIDMPREEGRRTAADAPPFPELPPAPVDDR